MEQDELIQRLKRSRARERRARQDAERLIEEKSRALYIANNELEAANAKIRTELRVAEEYIRSVLPKERDGELTTRWCFEPSFSLGGDALGYHDVDTNCTAFYLLDVCGHGVGSALLAVSVINAIRSASLPGVDFLDPVQVLNGLNRAFPMSAHRNRFFTIWYGVYDSATRQLHYASAGHPPALLETIDGYRVLDVRNTMIGVAADAEFESDCVKCPSGSRLTMFSDGTFEIKRADGSWGNMEEFLERLKSMKPDEPLETLLKEAREAAGRAELNDDFSLMQVRFGR